MLKPDVVPSIFPGFPNHLQPKVKKPQSLPHYRKSVEVTDVMILNDVAICTGNISSFNKHVTNHETDHNNRDIGTQTNRSVSWVATSTQTEESGNTWLELKKQVKVLKQNVKRKNSRITNLKDMLKMVRNEKDVDEDFESFILSHFHGKPKSMIRNKERIKRVFSKFLLSLLSKAKPIDARV